MANILDALVWLKCIMEVIIKEWKHKHFMTIKQSSSGLQRMKDKDRNFGSEEPMKLQIYRLFGLNYTSMGNAMVHIPS